MKRPIRSSVVAPHLGDGGTEVAPNPAALIESMRAFGYSLPTAVADLIDNSISAGARQVDVRFHWAGSASTLTVLDDGHGMDEPGLIEAMRLGSRSPVEQRAANDLGRFGLGLKSAAWSQARSLTVVTRTDQGPVLTRRWDLDHVTETRRWMLLDNATERGQELIEELSVRDRGTAVHLEHPDRLVGDADVDDEDALQRFLTLVRRTEEHLAMVFHRFLMGRDAIRITVNGNTVIAWDPFLDHHSATQRLPTEGFTVGGRRVEVAPYVLPHVSKLDAETHAAAAGPRGWNGQQGFYVYRSKRLLVAGDWLGLKRMQQEEHYKLARIRVDLDNSMDELWQIDVRKATARIPGSIQSEFQRIAKATRRRAADAYRFRGKTVARASDRQRAVSFVWERKTHRDGVRTFRVNRRHPVLEALGNEPEIKRAVERALRLAEENLPIEAIVMEAREHPDAPPRRAYADEPSTVAELLEAAHSAMVERGVDEGTALRALAAVEPFEAHPEVVQAFKERLEA